MAVVYSSTVAESTRKIPLPALTEIPGEFNQHGLVCLNVIYSGVVCIKKLLEFPSCALTVKYGQLINVLCQK